MSAPEEEVRSVEGVLDFGAPINRPPALSRWIAAKDIVYDRGSGETVALCVGGDAFGDARFIARAPEAEAAALLLIDSVAGQDRQYPPTVSWEALDALAAALSTVVLTTDTMKGEG